MITSEIRIWTFGGDLVHTLSGHTSFVYSLAVLPNGDIVSGGEDRSVRIWKGMRLDGSHFPLLSCPVDGECDQIITHPAISVWSVATMPNGDIVSSSEDRTVKIWRDGKCIQTITHPAVSIWSVAVCPETGDIVSGASDKIIRIFSRDPERQADPEVCGPRA